MIPVLLLTGQLLSTDSRDAEVCQARHHGHHGHLSLHLDSQVPSGLPPVKCVSNICMHVSHGPRQHTVHVLRNIMYILAD